MGLTSPAGNTIYVHPTFLYESLWNLALFVFLCIFIRKGRRKYNGQIILIYLFVYGIGRTLIEGLRTDSLYLGGTNIRVSQLLSAVLVIFSLAMLIYNGKRVKKGTLMLEPPYQEVEANQEDSTSEGSSEKHDACTEASDEEIIPESCDGSDDKQAENENKPIE